MSDLGSDTDFNLHTPVMLAEVVEVLSPQKGQSYLDLTAGYGGHSGKVLSLTKAEEKAVLVDRDPFAVTKLKGLFPKAEILNQDFAAATTKLKLEGQKFDMILADLGVSSVQLDTASRGFSFQNEGPLDMRMDSTQSLTATDILNNYSAEQLQDILIKYGDEPRARRIAELIVEQRPLSLTGELTAIVKKVYGAHWRNKNPATKTFQAIRIAVNSELDQLEEALQNILSLLNPGGRLAIITFHSGEDRIVKKFFSERANKYDGCFKDLQKLKPFDKIEIVRNPRSRSACLRSVTFTKTNTI